MIKFLRVITIIAFIFLGIYATGYVLLSINPNFPVLVYIKDGFPRPSLAKAALFYVIAFVVLFLHILFSVIDKKKEKAKEHDFEVSVQQHEDDDRKRREQNKIDEENRMNMLRPKLKSILKDKSLTDVEKCNLLYEEQMSHLMNKAASVYNGVKGKDYYVALKGKKLKKGVIASFVFSMKISNSFIYMGDDIHEAEERRKRLIQKEHDKMVEDMSYTIENYMNKYVISFHKIYPNITIEMESK